MRPKCLRNTGVEHHIENTRNFYIRILSGKHLDSWIRVHSPSFLGRTEENYSLATTKQSYFLPFAGKKCEFEIQPSLYLTKIFLFLDNLIFYIGGQFSMLIYVKVLKLRKYMVWKLHIYTRKYKKMNFPSTSFCCYC